MKLHLGCDDDIREGFENLDPKINGWTFESGLPYADASVDAITISHALMYVNPQDWLNVCAEFFRVLQQDGVVRITEDDTESATSPRSWNPWKGAKTLTGPGMASLYLRKAGFRVSICGPYDTRYKDTSILIHHRIAIPNYVFYIEGIKP